MRILFLSGREPSYPRNKFLIHALSQIGVVDVPMEKGGFPSAIFRRSLLVSLAAFPWVIKHKYDLIVVGFLGQLLMLPAGILKRQPVLFDAFISTYDTLVEDRKRFSPKSIPAHLALWLDRTSCHLADHILLDTQAQIDYFTAQFNISPDKMERVWVGSDENLFYPRPEEYHQNEVLFIGNFVPLQGIDVILHSAKLLDKTYPEIKFRLIGKGITYPQAVKYVEQNRLTNLHFDEPVPFNQLPDQIAAATVCLGGHFGSSAKAARVIAGKTYHCLAMGKVTIVGDNPANRELLTHDEDAWFCPMNDPYALAESIRLLISDPDRRTRLGLNARQTFLQNASLAMISQQIQNIVNSLMSESVRR